MKYRMVFLIGLLLCGWQGYTQLRLPQYFSDDMVLQRDQPIAFWGKGIPGENVKVLFDKEIQESTVLPDSVWQVVFSPRQAHEGPLSIHITHNRQVIKLSNIVVGDVWLCMGQSNMEWPLSKDLFAKIEIPQANIPQLRLFNTTYPGKYIYNQPFADSVLQGLNSGDFFKGTWTPSTPSLVKDFSAVGYYFGKQLQQTTGVPIGLMNLAVGGAPIEALINPEALREDPDFAKKMNGNWLMNNTLPVWIRQRGTENTEHIPAERVPGSGPSHAFKPGFVFESGLAELTKLPIKGIIWYQGESNAQEMERVSEYAALQTLMISDYRKLWVTPDLPFYSVQLSAIDTLNYKSQLWPEFRNAQLKAFGSIQNSGLVVSHDIGSKHDVHPRNKKEVGYRLARWALHSEYGTEGVPSGPLPEKATFHNGKVIVYFSHALGLKPINEDDLRGFSLNGLDTVSAEIRGAQVVIKARVKPDFVYYAWAPWPEANLINAAGLPVPTFKLAVEE